MKPERSCLALASWLALACGAAWAEPVVGPQQRIDVAGGTFAANETTAAASPDAEIVAAWNDWRASPTVANEVIRAGVAISLDGGTSWVDFVLRPPAPNQSGVEGDPMTAFDPRTGTLWAGAISFSGNGGLYVARKNPGDAFFQPSVMADTQPNIDKCWMVAGRNETTAASTRVYIAYNFGLIRSDDLGASWSSPVSLGAGLGFLPRIGPNGEVYVAYWDYNQERFEVRRSTNGGASFTTHVIAARMDTWGIETSNTRFPGTMRVPPLVGLDVDRTTGTLYAVWPDTTDFSQGGSANVDVYFSKSVDQGTSWSTPVILNGEGPFIGDQFFPWIEVDPSGRLHVLFLDTRQTNQPDGTANGMIDAYYAYSEDGGDGWGEIRLSPQSWNSNNDGLSRPVSFLGDYLGMAVNEFKAWPVYLDTHAGDTDTYTHTIDFCETIDEITGFTVDLSPDNSQLTFHWVDTAAATAYVVLQDFSAYGTFGVKAGPPSPSGVTGLTIDAPPGSRYYLVAGRNACGPGPK